MSITSEQIKTIIKNQIRGVVDLSNESAKLDELGIDSLDVVEILLSIEEEYNVIVMEDQLQRGCSLGEFIRVVASTPASE